MNVIGCRDLGSVGDLIALPSVKSDAGIPNTPAKPETNKKCHWNGGTTDCYPLFKTGNCAQLDAQIASTGRSQTTLAAARLWSPCYDAVADAGRLTMWNDRGSSIQHLDTVDFGGRIDPAQLWTQFEISLSSQFFFDPENTTSSKLTRIERKNTASCKDPRFADLRFTKISPSVVKLGPKMLCPVAEPPTGDQATLTPADAGNWIRVTTMYDSVSETLGFWVKNLDTNTVLSASTINTYKGKPMDIVDDMNVSGLKILMHSTAHKVNGAKPSPNFWVRHFIVSRGPIAH